MTWSRAEHLIELGRTAEALALLDAAAAQEPENADILCLISRAHLRAERYAAARAAASAAARVQPDRDQAFRLIAMSWINSGEGGAGLEAARTALGLRPHDPYNHYTLAYCLMERGQYDEARASLDIALAARPDEGAFHRLAGDIARESGRRAEARRHYTEALRLDPLDTTAMNNLAINRRSLRSWFDASQFRRVLRHDPHDRTVRENMDRVALRWLLLGTAWTHLAALAGVITFRVNEARWLGPSMLAVLVVVLGVAWWRSGRDARRVARSRFRAGFGHWGVTGALLGFSGAATACAIGASIVPDEKDGPWVFVCTWLYVIIFGHGLSAQFEKMP